MAELKTKQTENDVAEFLASLPEERQRECLVVTQLMQEVSRAEPKMWGDKIVGFGRYDYKYQSGRKGTWFTVGFSPRKQNLTIYIMAGFERYQNLLGRLGKHSLGKSCLYIKKLADVDLAVLRELVEQSVKVMNQS